MLFLHSEQKNFICKIFSLFYGNICFGCPNYGTPKIVIILWKCTWSTPCWYINTTALIAEDMTAMGLEPTTSPVWLNCWVFVYKLSGSGFESQCIHLNFRFCTCFKQVVPWHSGNYTVWIHSETHLWHDKNIQHKICLTLLQFYWLKLSENLQSNKKTLSHVVNK